MLVIVTIIYVDTKFYGQFFAPMILLLTPLRWNIYIYQNCSYDIFSSSYETEVGKNRVLNIIFNLVKFDYHIIIDNKVYTYWDISGCSVLGELELLAMALYISAMSVITCIPLDSCQNNLQCLSISSHYSFEHILGECTARQSNVS